MQATVDTEAEAEQDEEGEVDARRVGRIVDADVGRRGGYCLGGLEADVLADESVVAPVAEALGVLLGVRVVRLNAVFADVVNEAHLQGGSGGGIGGGGGGGGGRMLGWCFGGRLGGVRGRRFGG